jgi:hypothetical protein
VNRAPAWLWVADVVILSGNGGCLTARATCGGRPTARASLKGLMPPPAAHAAACMLLYCMCENGRHVSRKHRSFVVSFVSLNAIVDGASESARFRLDQGHLLEGEDSDTFFSLLSSEMYN